MHASAAQHRTAGDSPVVAGIELDDRYAGSCKTREWPSIAYPYSPPKRGLTPQPPAPSNPLRLPLLAERVCLRALTLIVDAGPPPPPPTAAPANASSSCISPQHPAAEGSTGMQTSLRQQTCRLLLGLFALDALSWTCFKVVQLEAIENARIARSLDPVAF